LIYDFGGGTFDLSILNIVDGQYMEAGTGGDRWLGGDDIDHSLQELVLDKVQKQYKISDLKTLISKLPQKKRFLFEKEIRMQAEQAKIQLSSTNTANIDISNLLEDENGDIIDIDVSISRKDLEDLVKPFVQRTLDLIDQLLKEVGYDITMIDNILLVGGSSCIPLVKKMLSEKYGTDKIRLTEKPMLTVAEGAGILSHRLGEDYEAPIGMTNVIEEISYSTNHNYFIKLMDADNAFHLEKIIEKQVPLPVKTKKIFKTTVDKQKIAHLLLFSDAEEGKTEQMTQGFYTIDEDLPLKSEIVFNIEMDINEIFQISAYTKAQKNNEKSIVLGRGNKDSKALNFIGEQLEKINSGTYTKTQQEIFYKAVQKEIDKANKIGKDQSDSDIWSEIGTSVYTSFEQAENLKDDVDELEIAIIFASILCNEYPMLMERGDLTNLKALLKDHNSTSDSFEKIQISENIKKITDEYPILIALFTVKMAALNAQKTNPAKATRLFQMHDTIVSHFKNGNKDEAFGLLDEALELREEYFSGFSAGTGITK